MAKKLDLAKIVDVEKIIGELERNQYLILPVGDKYHDEDEVVNEKPVFVDGKPDTDAEPYYYFVNAIMTSTDSKYNLTDVELKSNTIIPFSELKIDDTVTIKIDREKTQLAVSGTQREHKYVSLDIYVKSVTKVE